MVFHLSLNNCKSPQVSRTFLGILAELNYAVVWLISSCPLISKSSSPFTNHLRIVPGVPITVGITVILSSIVFQFSRIYLSFRLPSVLPCGQLGRPSPLFGSFSLILLIIIRSCRLAEIR